MQGILCVDNSPQASGHGGDYNRVDGLQVYVAAGMFTNHPAPEMPGGPSDHTGAPFWIYYAADNSTFSNITVASYVPGPDVFVEATCCGASFYNLTVNGVKKSGPLLEIGTGAQAKLGGMTTGSTSFFGGSIANPGPGQHAIEVNGSAYQYGVNFYGTYVASGPEFDTTTSLIWVASPYYVSTFSGGVCSMQMNEQMTNYCFEMENNWTQLNISGWSISSDTTPPNTGDFNMVTGGGVNVVLKNPYSNPGQSGSLNAWSSNGTYLTALLYDSLKTITPADGTIMYCTDCNATCTAGTGSGRTCFREHGAWVH